jgi:hypothetical protein
VISLTVDCAREEAPTNTHKAAVNNQIRARIEPCLSRFVNDRRQNSTFCDFIWGDVLLFVLAEEAPS